MLMINSKIRAICLKDNKFSYLIVVLFGEHHRRKILECFVKCYFLNMVAVKAVALFSLSLTLDFGTVLPIAKGFSWLQDITAFTRKIDRFHR